MDSLLRQRAPIIGVLLSILLLFALAACSQPEPVEVTRVVEVPVEVPGETIEVEVTRVVEVMIEPEMVVATVPFQDEWASSPHANAESGSFRHWDEDDPAEIPANCAKCHSTYGMLDFLGADGSEAGMVNSAAAIGSVVECEACHNDVVRTKDSVIFPSGAEIDRLGVEARCMECHQGRASTPSVNASIENAGLAPEDVDVVSEDLGFTNIHYYAAAATQYGTLAMGGFEYEGKAYDGRFEHVAPYETCVDCHDAHTLEIKFDACVECHTDLREPADLVNVRTEGSLVDYDGDGDLTEGIHYEIEDIRAMLYSAMRLYAVEVAGNPLVYDDQAYPYFFIDSNNNGEIDEDEANFGNRFNSWTPRLAKAAYNFQVSLKDPGRYAHGGKYVIQLLYDSLEDLNQAISEPVDMSAMSRIDHGHFAGSEDAFRHWDDEGVVPASCSKCHTGAGLPFFLEHGVNISQAPSNGLNCASCHNEIGGDYPRYKVEEVRFPSGQVVSTGDLDSNLCLQCHQGRESTTSVNAAIGSLGDDELSERLSFLNIHYFAAGASLLGTEAKGAYEFADQEYLGRNVHVESFDTCIECHNTHALEVEIEDCAVCHAGVETLEDVRAIRFNEEEVYVDYDGDGDVEEGILGEIETIHTALYAAMQEYANNTEGVDPIIFSDAGYPYFFVDSNGNGEADPDETNFGNRYTTWTPRLLRAAYNYQFTAKDPGAYAHNGKYIIQTLYDSLANIGSTDGMTRP